MWTGLLGLVILALLNISEAAYFYVPDYLCEELGTCVGAVEVERREAISLRLVRKSHTLKARNNAPSHIDPSEPNVGLERQSNLKKRELPILKAVSPSMPNTAGINQDGTDYSYFVEAKLGSGGKNMYMLLDTGAPSTWVMGSECKSSACTTHNTFGPSDSTTYQSAPGSFNNSYGTGMVSGTIASDELVIGGIKMAMTFGVANKTSDDFNHFPMDGILGLSLKFINQPTYLQNLVASKQLKDNLFGVHLARASDGVNDGEITFGEINASKYHGSLEYTNVASSGNGNWVIPMDNVGLGQTQTEVTNRNAYIDTGTSYIFGPKADVAKFHALVAGSTSSSGESYIVPCSTTENATFAFSGVTYSVLSRDWVGPEVNGVCTSNIFGKPLVGDSWLLGDTFLKNVYTVFDIDNTRIGFADQAISAGSSNGSISTSSAQGTPFTGQEPSGALTLHTGHLIYTVIALAFAFWS